MFIDDGLLLLVGIGKTRSVDMSPGDSKFAVGKRVGTSAADKVSQGLTCFEEEEESIP
jgi:hypothetical protein